MNEEQNEKFFDLLAQKAIYGLDENEARELASFDAGTTELEFRSLELTAAAIHLAGLEADEQMPSFLRERILDSGEEFIRSQRAESFQSPEKGANASSSTTGTYGSWFGWTGWATAALASVALAVNIWSTRLQPIDVAKVPTPVETPRALSPDELREELLRSEANVYKASWGAGNVKEFSNISGDIVWSEAKQTGYMRFRGLPVNDAEKTCYQLWIFDKTQDKATPIDGGVFNVQNEGEVIIPITAKLRALGPEMFAITIEKPGGVVVSKREKIAALAKIETSL
ncbi:MAG: anti-sigma factor [Acidobacteria bacterium]|nr:anti-sigma factor [Acidobacteriota bacterium]